MKKEKQKLTLDRPAIYEIKVPGHFYERWSVWPARMTLTVEFEDDGSPITTLTGTVDQAALQGVLRRLYSIGKPLISACCIDVG